MHQSLPLITCCFSCLFNKFITQNTKQRYTHENNDNLCISSPQTKWSTVNTINWHIQIVHENNNSPIHVCTIVTNLHYNFLLCYKHTHTLSKHTTNASWSVLWFCINVPINSESTDTHHQHHHWTHYQDE